MNPNQNLHLQLVQLRGQAEAWAAGRRVAGFKPPIGIRYNLNLLEVGRRELSDLIARWPGNSGDEDYPVPHPAAPPEAGLRVVVVGGVLEPAIRVRTQPSGAAGLVD